MVEPRDVEVFRSIQAFLEEVGLSPLANEEPVSTWVCSAGKLMERLEAENEARIPSRVISTVRELSSLTGTLRVTRSDSQAYSNFTRLAGEEIKGHLAALDGWSRGTIEASSGEDEAHAMDLADARSSVEDAIASLQDVVQELEGRLDRGEFSEDSIDNYELRVLRDVSVPTLAELVERIAHMGRAELGAWQRVLQRFADIATHPTAVTVLSNAAIEFSQVMAIR